MTLVHTTIYMQHHIYVKTLFYTISDKCGANMTLVRGRIRAGTEPFHNCIWYITLQRHMRINLWFNKFDLPSISQNKTQLGGTCNNSYVEILVGRSLVRFTFLFNPFLIEGLITRCIILCFHYLEDMYGQLANWLTTNCTSKMVLKFKIILTNSLLCNDSGQ